MASRTLRRRAAYRAINDHKRTRPRIILRVLLVMLVTFTMLTSGASAATILFYGENLPSLQQFKKHFQFQNTEFVDQQGHVLYDMADLSHAGGAQRVVEPLYLPGHSTAYYKAHGEDWLVGDDPCTKPPCAGKYQLHGIPLALQDATIATEDATFYSNPGFDPFSIIRAGYDDLTVGHIVSGASTITQQLVKQYILSNSSQTVTRKTEEIVLAAELTQKYPKSKILWYYLNGVFYGNQATGAEAAAKVYFHKDIWQLDAAQCAMLAGLPEAPTIYDPVNNRSAALARMQHVVALMYRHGYLTTNGKPDPSLQQKYMNEARHWPVFKPPRTSKRFPQFIDYAINQLEQMPQLSGKIYQGLEVVTSINPTLQDSAQQIVSAQISGLAGYNVTDGALVSESLDPACYGCILAMVGSADYKAPGGQINMADTPRQPGSSFKPFNYVWAFQHGLYPGTYVDDAPIAIPDPGNAADGGVYSPSNYDNTYHGTVTLRTALQNSLNIPAVKVEEYGATCDTCGTGGLQNIVDQAQRLGATSIKSDNPGCCGWALTLGGMPAGLRLVQETSAYGAFGSGGYLVPPTAIVKVMDRTTGKVLWDLNRDGGYVHRKQVLAPQYAYIMNNVLSDNASRCTPQVCEFEPNSPLYLGRTAAAKTGTTNSFTDNWTVGYTPDIVTGVWVGNTDYTPMIGTTGVTGAAPIWHDYMLRTFGVLNLPPKDFPEPNGVEIGSNCREPDAYGSPGTGPYDVWAGVEPYCSIPADGSSLPVPQTNPYQPPAASQPVPTAAAPVPTAAAPVPTVPAPTAPPALAPTQAPLQVAPTTAPVTQP